MEKVKGILKNTAAIIGVLTVVFGAAWKAFDLDTRSFTSMEKRVEAESIIQDLDPIKLYGEYIVDSIEEVNTQEWRAEQMKHDSVQDNTLKDIDSLLRLNIYLTNEIKKSE